MYNGNISDINPFRYRGYYYDIETGFYYLNSRYYDPSICRFINADDISYANASLLNGLNLYAYCGNNPVNNVDENGSAWWEWLIAGLTAISIIALSVITAGAILAVAPAIAGFASMTAVSMGLFGLSTAASLAVSIGAGILATSTIVLGINNAISIFGFNPLASIVGDDVYNVIQNTIGILGYSYIALGFQLPYPGTGISNVSDPNGNIMMNYARKFPKSGDVIITKLNDPRFPSWLGWQKYQIYSYDYTIHYIGNKWLNSLFGVYFDFKFVKGKYK